jgi:hypothetical protein
MRRARVYPGVLAAVAVFLVGCGRAERPTLAPPAEPRTIELGWSERFRSAGLVLTVGRLVLREDGWSADVGVQNRSRRTYRLGDGASLVLLDTPSRRELRQLTAELRSAPPSLAPSRASPRPPTELRPGAIWRGTISGPEVLRSGSVVRVLFGPYQRAGPRRLGESLPDALWVTDRSVRI